MTTEKTHYTPDELAEFKELLDAKLAEAESDMEMLKTVLASVATDAKGDDFAGEQLNREEAQQLATRQAKYISYLKEAQARIANGTYGICRVTGKLISKERLRLVPHATLSIAARNDMAKNA